MPAAIAGLVALSAVVAPGVRSAGAVEPPIQITVLTCDTAPEVVAVANPGLEPRDLAGWQLRSDPPDQEVFDLSVAGTLSPGETVYIQSGYGAAGTLVWSQRPVLRDGDPTDYVQMVDNAGQFVQQVNCAATSAGEIPFGGGPPSVASDTPALLTTVLGGWLTALGLAVLLLVVLGGLARGGNVPAAVRLAPDLLPPAQRFPRATGRHRAAAGWYLLVPVAALAVAALLAAVEHGRGHR